MIRKAHPSDYEEICRLCESNGISAANIALSQIFVFVDRRKIKGLIYLSTLNEILHLCVQSEYQRKKIATKLLRYVRRNRPNLMGYIKVSNIAGLRLLQSQGFKAIAETKSADTEENYLFMAWAQGCFSGFRKVFAGDS